MIISRYITTRFAHCTHPISRSPDTSTLPRSPDTPLLTRRIPPLLIPQCTHSTTPLTPPAGSRGITNIATITKAVVDWCTSQGAIPFVVPSMGTHGGDPVAARTVLTAAAGATADGQRELVESLGCTEEALGCPIRCICSKCCLAWSCVHSQVVEAMCLLISVTAITTIRHYCYWVSPYCLIDWHS